LKTIPDALYECIVDKSEAIPFFIEEMIKMLIDQGVIKTVSETWQVRNRKSCPMFHVPHPPPASCSNAWMVCLRLKNWSCSAAGDWRSSGMVWYHALTEEKSEALVTERLQPCVNAG